MKKNILIAKNLKKLRKINELTAEKLANNLKIELRIIRSYEAEEAIPPINTLIKIAKYFGISIDFFILGNKTLYPRNLKLLFLSEKIDKLDMNERYKVEGSVNALLGKNVSEITVKFDNSSILLTKSFHENIKILRKSKEKTQHYLAKEIGVKRLQIALYEKKACPRIEKLLKLSEVLTVSIHALLTGNKLFYSFQNKSLQLLMLKADHLLSLKDQQFIIKQMQHIIKDSK